MSAPTLVRSAFPSSLDELLPAARRLAVEVGGIPSQNRLKAHLRVGTDKARQVRQLLTDEHDQAAMSSAPGAVSEPIGPGSGRLVPVVDRPDPGPVEDQALPLVSPLVEPVTVTDAIPVPDSERVATGMGGVGRVRAWPVWLLALPAFVAIWSGWVGLGELTGFGRVHPLPGIWDSFSLNSAITLPVGVETYAAFALRVWLSGRVPDRARRFAKRSAIGSLVLGAGGQVAYHLMSASHVMSAPWWITTLVACLPVAVLGMGAALAHLIHHDNQ